MGTLGGGYIKFEIFLTHQIGFQEGTCVKTSGRESGLEAYIWISLVHSVKGHKTKGNQSRGGIEEDREYKRNCTKQGDEEKNTAVESKWRKEYFKEQW